MAWYVEHLIKNKLQIEQDADIESTIFSDYVTVMSVIASMKSSATLSKVELSILDLLTDNASSVQSSIAVSLSRPTYYKRLVNLTDRIAEMAGYDFTDDGFIERLGSNYKLNESQIDTVRKYMSSKFKHKIMRKRYNASKTIS